MDPFGLALMAMIGAIGLIHLSWALGGQWPGKDPISLHDRVVGTPGRAILNRWSWALLAVCFFSAVVVIWITHQPILDELHALIVYPGYLVLILVFGLRGVAPYVTEVFAYAHATSFYTLNRRYYAPICLAIAASLILDFPPGLERFISR